MTNHEYLAKATGHEEHIAIEALEMLLAQIEEDQNAGRLLNGERSYKKYIDTYKAMVVWLNSEKGEQKDAKDRMGDRP